MKSLLVTSFALIAVAGITITAQTPMRPGRWETTMQMQMANMPIQMPEMKTTQCVTPEALEKDVASGLPRGMNRGGQDDCKVSDYKTAGNTVTWKIACSQAQMTGSGEVTFSGDSYTGTMKAAMSQGEMSMKISGKRLGDCTQ